MKIKQINKTSKAFKKIKQSEIRYTKSIFIDNIEVGIIMFSYENGRFYIMYLEIYKEFRSRGYGRDVINKLRNKGQNSIYGDSIYSSIGFWQNIGAEFEEDIDDAKEGICIPFTIE